MLCEGDYVLQQVMEMFASETAEYRRIVSALTVIQLEDDRMVDFDELAHYACTDLDDDGMSAERATNAIQSLLFNNEAQDEDGERFALNKEAFTELRALYFDLRVRHSLSGDEAIEYLINLTNEGDP